MFQQSSNNGPSSVPRLVNRNPIQRIFLPGGFTCFNRPSASSRKFLGHRTANRFKSAAVCTCPPKDETKTTLQRGNYVKTRRVAAQITAILAKVASQQKLTWSGHKFKTTRPFSSRLDLKASILQGSETSDWWRQSSSRGRWRHVQRAAQTPKMHFMIFLIGALFGQCQPLGLWKNTHTSSLRINIIP